MNSSGERKFYDIAIIFVFVNAVLCLLDFAQVRLTGSEGSQSYGRHQNHKTFASRAPTLPNRLGWVLMECPSVIAFLIFYSIGKNASDPVPLYFFFLWQSHYVQRTFIYSIFLIKSGPGRRQNSLLCFIGFIFNTLNSYLNATQIAELGDYPKSYFHDARLIIGTILFVIGYIINRHSDHILLKLRTSSESTSANTTSFPKLSKENEEKEEEENKQESEMVKSGNEEQMSIKDENKQEHNKGGEEVAFVDSQGSKYKIPRGGMFEYVSCANYFGEIIIWLGWAIATWSLSGLAFLAFTMGNLVPRAYWHHRWYHQKFPGEYPKNRKAIFPFLF